MLGQVCQNAARRLPADKADCQRAAEGVIQICWEGRATSMHGWMGEMGCLAPKGGPLWKRCRETLVTGVGLLAVVAARGQ